MQDNWTSLGTQAAMTVRRIEKMRADQRRFDRIVSLVIGIEIGVVVGLLAIAALV
jgi:hypothetical protein